MAALVPNRQMKRSRTSIPIREWEINNLPKFCVVIFSLLKLPLPAPPVLSAVMGVVGIYVGGEAYKWVVEKWFS